ncbi:hypothetical protein SAMN06265375_1011609 [Muriicola jejuensis]|nr:hypothetical protein SAMN06265375_1011609 [Muriicola jejuensis]
MVFFPTQNRFSDITLDRIIRRANRQSGNDKMKP